jgi:hypothetical protein
VKVNKWQVALPGLFLKFRFKQVQSDQSETVVYANSNVDNVKWGGGGEYHPPPSVFADCYTCNQSLKTKRRGILIT